MNKQNQERILTRITKGYYRKATFAAIATLIISLCFFCYLLGIKFRFNIEYNYDFRALVASVGLSITSFITALYCDKKKLHLFPAITLWVLLGLFSYTLLSAIWGSGEWPDRLFSGWHRLEENRLEQVKTILTTIGGIGGVGYLVIKYRERSASERGEADEKLLNAVQQLGDSSAQVRIAGVYALTDIADTYKGTYHQRVVNILCGYLRSDRLLKDANGQTRYATSEDGRVNHDHPLSADGAVESAILQVLASHLRTTHLNSDKIEEPSGPGVWSTCSIDLHNAELTEEIDFGSCHIEQMDARGAKFYNTVMLAGSNFANYTNFNRANFKKLANFEDAYFDFPAHFVDVNFDDIAQFEGATFHRTADFSRAEFGREACFRYVDFRITGIVSFIESIFHGDAIFEGATFSSPFTFFRNSTFIETANFTPGDSNNKKRSTLYTPYWLSILDSRLIANSVEVTFSQAAFNYQLKDGNMVAFPKYDNSIPSIILLLKKNGLPLGADWKIF